MGQKRAAKFERTLPWAILSVAVTLLVSFALFVIAAESPNHKTWQSILEGLAGALLGIGVLGIVFDLSLKRAFGSDLLHAVGIKQASTEFGLVDIRRAAPDWKSFLARANLVSARPLNFEAWLDENLDTILSIAKTNAIQASICLPRSGTAAAVYAAKHANTTDLSGFDQRIRDQRLSIDRKWSLLEQAGDLHKNANLTLYDYDDPPEFGIYRNGDAFMIELARPGDGVSGVREIYIEVCDGTESAYAEWLKSHSERKDRYRAIDAWPREPGTQREHSLLDEVSTSGNDGIFSA